MFLGCGFFRERPRQHEFGLEHRPAAGDDAVQGRPHPPEHRMPQPMLDAFDCLPGIAFVPMAVEGLGHKAELDDEVAGQVLRLGLAPFLAPEADQGGFVAAHDDLGIRAADKRPALDKFAKLHCIRKHFAYSRFVETSGLPCETISHMSYFL